ncbi:MAG: type II toxin-antitoxin system RelE/ParE family toxin [Quinella sp. 1Q7]|nr:type II toxin-antitoxin system RelE/ParE family toxin [Quinella sp. 1Q7]
MRYSVKYKKSALKKLNKLDAPVRERIKKWIETNLDGCENPRAHGKALSGEWHGYWRYRVGDYRIVAQIKDDKVIILVVKIDKRGAIYD